MFDARLRPLIDRPMNKLALPLRRTGLTADTLTWIGLAFGLAAALCIALDAPWLGLALFAANRLLDGLDGALARQSEPFDRGGFLDIVCDFLVYAAIPLGFAAADPTSNALAASVLLASFIASGTTFLAFAAVAAKRGLTTAAQGPKSIYYLAGLAEGFETIIAFALMYLWPNWFSAFAYTFAAICFVSAAARVAAALRLLR